MTSNPISDIIEVAGGNKGFVVELDRSSIIKTSVAIFLAVFVAIVLANKLSK